MPVVGRYASQSCALTTAVHSEFGETLAVTVQRKKFKLWLDNLPIFSMRSNPDSKLSGLEGQSHSYKRLRMTKQGESVLNNTPIQ